MNIERWKREANERKESVTDDVMHNIAAYVAKGREAGIEEDRLAFIILDARPEFEDCPVMVTSRDRWTDCFGSVSADVVKNVNAGFAKRNAPGQVPFAYFCNCPDGSLGTCLGSFEVLHVQVLS